MYNITIIFIYIYIYLCVCIIELYDLTYPIMASKNDKKWWFKDV